MTSLIKGMTLTEIIITLSIMLILITIAVPPISASYQYYRADKAIRQIQQGLLLARNYAVSYQIPVTVCPSIHSQCSNNWQNSIIIFTDINKTNKVDNNEKVIQKIDHTFSEDTISFNRNYVRFQADGSAAGSNGTLIYCPSTKDSDYSKALIINRSGRVRLSEKSNIGCS